MRPKNAIKILSSWKIADARTRLADLETREGGGCRGERPRRGRPNRIRKQNRAAAVSIARDRNCDDGRNQMTTLLTVAETCAALPSKPTERWINDFLRKTKVDPQGRPLYRIAARAKLVYLDRLIEALPCPSSSCRPAKTKARTSRSGARTSASALIRAAELTNDPSLIPSFADLSGQSSAANTRRGRLHLVKGSAHS